MTQNRTYEDGGHHVDWLGAAEAAGETSDDMDAEHYAHELYLTGMSKSDDGLDDFDFE